MNLEEKRRQEQIEVEETNWDLKMKAIGFIVAAIIWFFPMILIMYKFQTTFVYIIVLAIEFIIEGFSIKYTIKYRRYYETHIKKKKKRRW